MPAGMDSKSYHEDGGRGAAERSECSPFREG